MNPSFTVSICAINSKYVHSSLAPWCLLAGIKAYCKDEIIAEALEGTIHENPEDIAARIADRSPQAVGFCCYIWNISIVLHLIRLIKKRLPETVIVLGGPEVSYRAEEILREEPFVEYVISGEGEKPFALLMDAIRYGNDVQTIPGVCFRKYGLPVVVSPHTPDDVPPSPYSSDFFDALNGRIAYLETSRGCPFSCAFCLSGRCGGVRFFPAERAKKELLLLANSGARTIKLVDRTFNANSERAYDLFQFVIENHGSKIPKGVCFHFEIGGDLLDEKTLQLLEAAPAGLIQLEIGLQSFCEKTLAAINRKTDVERLKRSIRRIVEKGNIHVHIDLIAGLPYEGLRGFSESFNTAYRLNAHVLQLGFLKLLHGAPMRESPAAFPCDYDQSPPYEVTSTPWLSSQDMILLHETEDALERLFNSGRFSRTLHYLIEAGNLQPFELFSDFGRFAAEKGTKSISLDDYTALVYEYFANKEEIEKCVLRDALVCDRLATDSSGRLSSVLQIKDRLLKTAKMRLETDEATRAKKGVKRGIALLYSERRIVYSDYQTKNPVTGEYPLFKICWDDIL